MAMAHRPLSPYWIYRFAYTMALSILHRLTGLVLSLGLVLLVAWLVALASGTDCYVLFVHYAGSWPVRLLMAGGMLAFCYHLANGVRHLLWDLGIGLERAEARRSARIVIVVVLLLFAVLLWLFFFRTGGSP
jgi:succinate dehydrogenase / fumarate reductase cytochrome b subunit